MSRDRAQRRSTRIDNNKRGATLRGLFENVGGDRNGFSVGLAPMIMMTSACSTSLKVAVTAPEPIPSISAATDEAWHRRVQ